MRIYVDLDGVLADFDHAAAHVFGMPPREFEELHGAGVFWKRLGEAAGFYRKLPWMPDGIELWNFVVESAAPGLPIVLTGLPLGEWAEPDKLAWCARELGRGFPVICCMSIDKRNYCTAGDVLIDDRDSARLPWVGAGGVFIHFTGDLDDTKARLTEILDRARGASSTPPIPA